MSGKVRDEIRGGGGLAKFLLAVCLLLCFAPPAAAERGTVEPEKPGDLPIEIAADRLLADSTKETVTFEGNVRATQGDVTLFSDRLQAQYSGSERAIDRIVAEGNVRVLHAGREARAARAVFHNREQRIDLTGGASLVQGEDSLKGETVTIFLRENRSVVSGGEGGRVRAVIHPRGVLGGKGQEGR